MTSQSTSYLSQGALNMNILRDFSRRDLLDCIDSTGGGKKVIVMDERLVGPIGLVSDYTLLKEHGVEKLILLTQPRIDTDLKTIIFLTRPKAMLMHRIAAIVKQHSNEGVMKNYHVFFTPRKTLMCERILETEGVLGDLTLGEYQLDLLAFDSDLLSLELDASFRECYLDGDTSSLFYVARSIMKLQTIFGTIPHIAGKGFFARNVADMISRMKREIASENEVALAPEIDTLLLLDRGIDLITPLCSQLTYEGLIDENFGIENSHVTLAPEISGNKDGKKVKIPLNSGDHLFQEIRDMNFSSVGPLLAQRARFISQEYEQRHEAKTVGQIREFVNKLGGLQLEHQSLRVHTNMAEVIMKVTKEEWFLKTLETEQTFLIGVDTDKPNEHIEDMIGRKDDLSRVLKLIILQSLTNGGLKPKVLDYYRHEILQTYGTEHVTTLLNLEKSGLTRKNDGRSNFPTLRKLLRLVVEDVNEQNPNDIAYTYSGYAPLSVRLIEQFSRGVGGGGWRSMEEVLKLIPGPSFEEQQQLPASLFSRRSEQRASRTGEVNAPQKVTLVFFIGGVTFAELSAIRFLSKKWEDREYVIATTHLINSNSLVASISEQLENGMTQPPLTSTSSLDRNARN